MERKIVLASHGEMAAGLLHTAEMIVGSFRCETQVYSLLPGMLAEDDAKKLEEEIIRCPHKEFVILCDLYGASVFTAMYPLLTHANVRLFTGMNLNMLLALYLEHPQALQETDCEQIEQAAKEGARHIQRIENSSEDF